MELHEIPLGQVRITDAFWSPRQRLIAEETVPYMYRILTDACEGVPSSHAIENLRIAAGEAEGAFAGMVFQDSDVYKWVETAAYALSCYPNPATREKLRAVCRTVERAQQPDGYLNSYFTLVEPEHHWQNLLECHELYCAGHFLEAAAAVKEALGEDWLLPAARRLADHIADVFAKEGIPGHQEIEIGLLRLYRITGEKRYLRTAMAFLDRRGQEPDYFARHTPAHPGYSYGDYPIDPSDTAYNQTYAPVRAQREGRGHAVRCLYMLAAMADAAALTGDTELQGACRRMLQNISERKMYVTGGLGSRADREQFGDDFELPNDRGYNETCASVAMVFFLHRMLNMTPMGAWADLMERELYNGALAGMGMDGKHFFYVNPLEVVPGVSGVAEGLKHVKLERPEWLPCACCPPNLSRLIASLGRYLFSESADTLYIHLTVGCEARTSFGRIAVRTEYPYAGHTSYVLHPDRADFRLSIHLPAFAESPKVRVSGESVPAVPRDGYLTLDGPWRDGDTVTLDFDLPVRRLHDDPRNVSAAGRTALAKGPFIYCAEGVDHPGVPLSSLTLSPLAAFEPDGHRPSTGDALFLKSTAQAGSSTLPFHALPYYAWGNRGPNEMNVWIRENDEAGGPLS